MNADATFRGVAALDLVAVRQRLDGPLALWYASRALDQVGSGRISLATLRAVRRDGTLRRILHQGEGTFWRREGAVVHLHSLDAVMAALNVSRAAGRYSAPLDVLRARTRRGWLALNAVALIYKKRPPGATEIARLCGMDRATIFRWLRAWDWPRQRRVKLLSSLKSSAERAAAREAAGGKFFLTTRRSIMYFAEQQPNLLHPGGVPVRRTRRRSPTSAALRSIPRLAGNGTAATGAGRQERDTPRQQPLVQPRASTLLPGSNPSRGAPASQDSTSIAGKYSRRIPGGSVASLAPLPEVPSRPCRRCGRSYWWRSTYGLVVCAACHPPAHPSLVASEWIHGVPASEWHALPELVRVAAELFDAKVLDVSSRTSDRLDAVAVQS